MLTGVEPVPQVSWRVGLLLVGPHSLEQQGLRGLLAPCSLEGQSWQCAYTVHSGSFWALFS